MANEPCGNGEGNVRVFLGRFIGMRVVDITQHDKDEFADDPRHYVMLMFEDGTNIKFWIGDGFSYDDGTDDDDIQEG